MQTARRTTQLHRKAFVLMALVVLSAFPIWAQSLTTTVLSPTERESLPHKFSGIVLAYESGRTDSRWRGSGSVAKHPKIVVSCAHVIHDGTAWFEGDFRWFWKWPNSTQPPASQGQLMRGAVRWASYHTEKRNDIARGISVGSSSANAFDYDITGFWSFENTASGGYAGWHDDGRAAMKSTRQKMISGYPARPFGTWDFSMYRTGPFTNAFAEVGKYGGGVTTRYMRPNLETVPLGGNSGGPLWVIDVNGQWGQAGVFVSGSTGVTALDSSSWGIITQAINNAGGSTPSPPPPPSPSDDHSNTATNATVLTLGAARSGSLETGGDIDFFRFTAPSTGDFRIETTGSTDVYGSLLSSSLAVLAEDDDAGADSNFLINRRLSAGTYYVRVRGYSTSTTGGYSLRVNQTSVVAPEIEITGLSSRVVTDGDTVPGAADGTHFGTLPVSGGGVARTFTIHNRGNDTLSLSGSPRVSLSGSGASHFSVTSLPSSTVSGGSSTTFVLTFQPLSHGTHVATVSIANNDADENPYDFGVTGTRTAPTNNDPEGGSFTSAWQIPTSFGSNSSYGRDALIDFGGDEDYYRFDVTQTAQFTIETKGLIDTYGYLYSSSGTVLLQDDDSGENVNFRITRQLTPGTYFVRVRGYSTSTQGAYRLEIRSNQPVPEINVATPDLTPIPDGSTDVSISMGTDFGSVIHASGVVERTFRIENFGSANLLLSGQPLVQITGAAEANFQIVANPAATVIPGGFTTFRVRFQPTLPGTHSATLLIVNNDANENPYDFMVRGVGSGTLDDHGNTLDAARSVSLPSTTTGAIERGGDIDMFRFTVHSSRTVTLRSTGATDLIGHLLDSAGRQIAQDDDSAGYPNFRISRILHPGTHYAKVRGFGSSTTGAYQFVLEAGPLEAPEFFVTGLRSRLISANETLVSGLTGTDFGYVRTQGRAKDRSFALRNRGIGTVSLSGNPPIRIVGPDAAAFAVVRQPLTAIRSRGASGFAIRFDPRREGWHQATVEIPSNDGANPLYRFAIGGNGNGYITTPDDHGDTFYSATEVGSNSNTTGNLGHQGDQDWYSFSVGVESFVTVETTGATDTFGHWHNAAGRQIKFDDDSGVELNMSMSATVPPGTYRIRVRGYDGLTTGAYSLAIRSQTAIPDLNVTGNYWDIPSGTTDTTTDDGTHFGSIAYRRGYRNAVFRIHNEGNGTLVFDNPRVALAGLGAVHFRILSLPATQVPPGGVTTFAVRYDPSGSGSHTAMVQVRSNDSDETPYTFNVSGYGLGPITTDDHGNSIGAATPLPLATTLPGHLERAGDVDFFRIDVSSAGQLTLNTTGDTDTYGRLYDSNGSEIAYDDDSGEGLNFNISSAVQPGSYYLRVSGYEPTTVGVYQVRATLGGATPDDHGNTFGTASSIAMGGSRTGTLQAGDVDMFVFTLASPANVLINTTGATDTFGELYNSSGSLLTSDDDSGTGVNFEILRFNLPAGTYYAKVRGFSGSTNGAYTLFLSTP